MQYNLGKVSIRPRGAYNAAEGYTALDAVSHLGGMWLCIAAVSGVEPGAGNGWNQYWMVLANGIDDVIITTPSVGKALITVTLSDGSTESLEINVQEQPLPLKYINVNVPVSAWAADPTYADYPYKATIPLTDSNGNSPNVNCYPQVTLSVADAMSGLYAPTAATYNGGVYIYASAIPNAAMTIPTIVCTRWSYDGTT